MDEELVFPTPDGRKVLISVTEDLCQVEVYTEDRQRIGQIGYILSSDDDSHGPSGETALLNNLHLEGPHNSKSYKRQGIGRACLQALGSYGYHLTARPPDGFVRDDGSHLTGEGPRFITQMVREGLVSWEGHGLMDDGEDDVEGGEETEL